MKALITGANGQLGWELTRTAPADADTLALDRTKLDITDARAVSDTVAHAAPELIVNAAAYTAVDKAESEPERAYSVNRDGAAALADAAAESGARLIQVSTDFVFDGLESRPYRPEDPTAPLGVYGASKLAGEVAVGERLGDRALIVRTGWVYSFHGGNFVKTMLRLMGERDELSVVADQVGTPTWARSLAEAIWRLAERDTGGDIIHYSDAGVASWYDLAVAIGEEAVARGLLGREIPVAPIASSAYPTPAKRPAYSVLDKSTGWERSRTRPQHWRCSLRAMLDELKDADNG